MCGARRIAEKDGEEGVIVACGGFTGGYTLFIKNNRAYYDYNYYSSGAYPRECVRGC